MTEPNVWEDRYAGRWPDPYTICPGPCEGLGVYPSCDPRDWPPGTPPLTGARDEDGWRFIPCPVCGGTGYVLTKADPP